MSALAELRSPGLRPATVAHMVDQALLTQVRQLDAADRIELINTLWATFDADSLPMSPEIAALVDERVTEADGTPLTGRSWVEVEKHLRHRSR